MKIYKYINEDNDDSIDSNFNIYDGNNCIVEGEH